MAVKINHLPGDEKKINFHPHQFECQHIEVRKMSQNKFRAHDSGQSKPLIVALVLNKLR
jgi:hypothetical protein